MYSRFDVVNLYADKLNLPVKIYELGADCYQQKIDNLPYSEIFDISKLHHKMAEWYWKANNKSKALAAEKKNESSLYHI